MAAKQPIELAGPFFGEEKPGPFQLNWQLRSGMVSASQNAHFTGE